MASAGRQGQPRGPQHGGSSGSSPSIREPVSAVRESVRSAGHQIREGAEHVGERIQQGVGSAREKMSQGYHRAEEMVESNPSQAMLVSFGLGFGLGLLLTIALGRREESWYERYVPESGRDLADAIRHLPERVADGIARNWPKSMSRS